MLDKDLIKDISLLKEVIKPTSAWRDSARRQVLFWAEQRPLGGYTVWESATSRLMSWRIKLAPIPAMSILVMVLIIFIIIPFAGGLASTQPGEIFYPVKRFQEKLEIVFKTTNEAKGDYYLLLAQRRLDEITGLSIGDEYQGKLLRDYNIDLSFARAYYQATPPAAALAQNFDNKITILKDDLKFIIVTNDDRQVYKVAYDLTDKLSNDALLTLVALGQSTTSNTSLVLRLNQEIFKVEQKLATVQDKIDDLPRSNLGSSKVVIESKKVVVAPADASKEATKTLAEARELIDKREFTLALQKIKEGEVITLKTEEVVDETANPSEKSGEVKGVELAPNETEITEPSTTSNTDSIPPTPDQLEIKIEVGE